MTNNYNIGTQYIVIDVEINENPNGHKRARRK